MLEHEYSPANRDVVLEVFDDDIIVLNLQNGKYFSFTDTGSALWKTLCFSTSACGACWD